MKLKHISQIELAAYVNRGEVSRLGVALIFVALVMIFAGSAFAGQPHGPLLVASAVIGAYMAMNIGANDVANNVGPAVGSRALTLGGAILIAAIFEAAGALIAGGEVVSTIKGGIINPDAVADSSIFVWAMMAALLGGAIWLNVATAAGAPVSTTHSIVGGVAGAGIAAVGFDVVDWRSMGTIVASWVISPVMGGIIAAVFLFTLKKMIFFKTSRLAAAVKVIPVMIAIMAWAFVTYLVLKGLKHLVVFSFPAAAGIGLVAALVTWIVVSPVIAKTAPKLEDSRESVNRLFTIPLIFAAALLSFAHGANDVANAVGPLAGIVDAIAGHTGNSKVAIPLWVMMVGALGISVGLALFGPKLIRTVGTEITELDRSRAFCIALSAAITVIVASQLGLPISSTHVAIGAVFGVGFLREYLEMRLGKVVETIADHHKGAEHEEVEQYLASFLNASIEDKERMLRDLKTMAGQGPITEEERKQLRKAYRRQLVKRSAFLKIVSAWIVTVPISAALSAMFFFMLRGMLLP